MRSCSMLLAVFSSALAGCTILYSSSSPLDDGIPYYLPRTVIVAKVDLWKIPGAAGVEDKYVVGIDTSTANTRGETIPDLKERFVLTYSSNPLFYDRYCVLTSANGLLSSVEYATEDKTPNVVLALSELGRKLGTGFATVRDQPLGAADAPVTSATVTFNPFDPVETDAAAQVINNSFGKKVITEETTNASGQKVVTKKLVNRVDVKFNFPELRYFGSNQDSRKCRGDGGLCFRTKVQTPMRLWDAVAGSWTTSVLVDVVNPYYVGHFDMDRAFLVEKVVRLGFNNGALNQVIMRKPSEALQAVKLPLAVVDAVLAVPANFMSTAAGNTQAINDQLQAQRAAIDELQSKLSTADTSSGTIYQPKCKGRAGLLNP
jgi:hypothetical protein